MPDPRSPKASCAVPAPAAADTPTPPVHTVGLSRRRFLGAAGAAGAVGAAAGLGLFSRPGQAAAVTPRRPPRAGPYQATWASVDKHPAAPEWFQDAKFGIYFHWGAFSVPAYSNEWYPRRMYDPSDDCHAHHIKTYGDPVTQFPYNNFIDGGRDLAGNHVQFSPQLTSQGGKFDPDEWAQLFADAGAKFAGPVAEHHDGFSMWNSRVNPWNSVQRGPKLDLVGLHRDAIRKRGLQFMVSLHHAYNFNGFYQFVPPQPTDELKQLYGQLPRPQENQLWYDRLKEVIDGYQPDLIWEDFDLRAVDEQQRLNFLSYYYNQAHAWKKNVVATFKDGYDYFGEVYDYERGGPGDLTRPYWLTDDSISSSSWCYTQGIGYYSSEQMTHAMIDRVSKGGTMLLNIAPEADGTIPAAQRTILLGMGDYLRNFGESIYSTRAWTVYGEGPTKMGGGSFTRPTAGTSQDIRFTRPKSDEALYLYATVLGYPGSTLTIGTLALGRFDLSTVTKIDLLAPLGATKNVKVVGQDGNGLHLSLPASAPFSALAYVVRMRFARGIPPLRRSGALLFDGTDFVGRGAGLGVGRYTSTQLTAALGDVRTISSIKPLPGYQVTGWSGDHFRGTSWTVTSDTPSLGSAADNAIRSLEITFDPTAWLRILNVTDTLALDGGGVSTANAPLKQYGYDGSPNLQWQLTDLGGGWFRLTNRTSGLVADGATAGDGRVAVQNSWTGAASQQWKVTDTGEGRFTFVNRSTRLALDSGGPQASGATTTVGAVDSTTDVLWTIAPA